MNQDTHLYKVVFNQEEQYSIWPAHKTTPAGWNEEGTVGNKDTCLQHIEKIWTDMRPLSLRQSISSAEEA
jgi:MbtH protein